MFKRVCTGAGIGDRWTPRELRTSFVSLMSHRGVSIEEIARLAGHASTRTTEVVYRRSTTHHHHRRRGHGRALHKNLTPRQPETPAKGQCRRPAWEAIPTGQVQQGETGRMSEDL